MEEMQDLVGTVAVTPDGDQGVDTAGPSHQDYIEETCMTL